jgi:hypothetical protein
MKYEIRGERLTLDEILKIHQNHDWIWLRDGRPGPILLAQMYRGKARYKPHTLYATVYLEASFLRFLIEKATVSAGSLNRLVQEIWGGKGRRSSSYTFNNMLNGKYGIYIHRLKQLCDLAEVPLSELETHVVKIGTRSKYAWEIYSKKRKSVTAADHGRRWEP